MPALISQVTACMNIESNRQTTIAALGWHWHVWVYCYPMGNATTQQICKSATLGIRSNFRLWLGVGTLLQGGTLWKPENFALTKYKLSGLFRMAASRRILDLARWRLRLPVQTWWRTLCQFASEAKRSLFLYALRDPVKLFLKSICCYAHCETVTQ